LFPEDVPHQGLDVGEVPLLRFMLYRLVKVQKSLNLLLIVQMVGNSAKAVILGDGGKIILSIVLP
jgi:hypothetical protein